MIKPYLFALVLASVLFTSCKKQYTPATAACNPLMLGFKGVYLTKPDAYADCTFGVLNRSTASSIPSTIILNTIHTNQGAYSTADQCYYSFKYYDGAGISTLYKIDLEGKVSAMQNHGFYFKYEGLVYNRFDNKSYAIRRNINAYGITISEISAQGNEYVNKDILKDVGYTDLYSYISASVNNATGDLFYQIGSSTTYNLFRYHPGDSASTRIHTSKKHRLMGLCFNANDNMLYCIRQDSVRTHFMKISPKGDSAIIDTLPFTPDRQFYSACIDRCANEYIISGKISATTGYFIRLNMTGTIVRRDTTQGIFQSMIVVD